VACSRVNFTFTFVLLYSTGFIYQQKDTHNKFIFMLMKHYFLFLYLLNILEYLIIKWGIFYSKIN